MLNKRVKEGIKKFHKPHTRIKFCLGTLSLVTMCVVLLIVATFTQIKVDLDISKTGIADYLKFEYIPQIPIVLFIAALLGECWGLLSVLIYIVLGLTPWFPIFALGGGLSYIFQYNFGYIFAYIFAVIFTANELKRNNSILNTLLGVFYGVFTIHIMGIIYMTIAALLRQDSWNFISDLIYFQSLSKILYDIVFGFIAVLIAQGCKKLLWIIMG